MRPLPGLLLLLALLAIMAAPSFVLGPEPEFAFAHVPTKLDERGRLAHATDHLIVRTWKCQTNDSPTSRSYRWSPSLAYRRWVRDLWKGRLAFCQRARAWYSETRSTTASWFGPGLYGNPTACGGTLSPSSNLVAHKTLACGTPVTVCYRGRCVRSVVGDRGPFVSGREFDLGPAVATALGFGGVDTVRVRIG